jgi:RecJ-like exonuclease
MNLRLACDLCGSQPCMCVEAECKACDGEGEIEHPHLQGAYRGSHAIDPPDPVMVKCEDCDGTGWIKCDRGGSDCPFDHCYCEAAWERQQEANASEPPMSADERHQLEWRQKQELRR